VIPKIEEYMVMTELRRLSVCVVICVLAAVFLAGGAVSADEGPGDASADKAPAKQSPVAKYAMKGYSIDGPIRVSAVMEKALVIFTGGRNRRIELKNIDVVVRNDRGEPLSMSDVVKGSRVFLCRKDKKMIVILLPGDTDPEDSKDAEM
jgi:hypothetical protein